MRKFLLITLTLGLILTACGKPVPPDKALYVGFWSASGVSLSISPEGRVDYQRVEGNSSTKLNGPISAYEGDNFRVGISILSKQFMVSKPPYRDGDQWKMVVDDIELSRAPTAAEAEKFAAAAPPPTPTTAPEPAPVLGDAST